MIRQQTSELGCPLSPPSLRYASCGMLANVGCVGAPCGYSVAGCSRFPRSKVIMIASWEVGSVGKVRGLVSEQSMLYWGASISKMTKLVVSGLFESFHRTWLIANSANLHFSQIGSRDQYAGSSMLPVSPFSGFASNLPSLNSVERKVPVSSLHNGPPSPFGNFASNLPNLLPTSPANISSIR